MANATGVSSMALTNEQIERRSLEIGKWGNLFMVVAGVAAAHFSKSDALLVDGLYSGVNFASAIVAARISVSVARPASRRYPFGYDALEALYVTFRSLVLLGIMVFAVTTAISKIVSYAAGGEMPELVFGPILIYSAVMVVTCVALAVWHRHNWKRSGQQSEILMTENRASVVDAVISGGVGGGFVAALLLRGTTLELLVPISDSIIVLVMCAVIVRQPAAMFFGALREVAGAAAAPEVVEAVKKDLEELLADRPYQLLDVIVTKLGRGHFVVSFVKPDEPIDGETADQLWLDLNTALKEHLGRVHTEIVIAAQGPYEESET